VPLIASEREPDRNAATLEVTIGLEQEAITDVFMIPISSKTRSGTIATARVGRTAESTVINRTELTKEQCWLNCFFNAISLCGGRAHSLLSATFTTRAAMGQEWTLARFKGPSAWIFAGVEYAKYRSEENS
jgi:hypothetical protein